jgi:ribosomal protein S18 acetylase RimI-like enzyme
VITTGNNMKNFLMMAIEHSHAPMIKQVLARKDYQISIEERNEITFKYMQEEISEDSITLFLAADTKQESTLVLEIAFNLLKFKNPQNCEKQLKILVDWYEKNKPHELMKFRRKYENVIKLQRWYRNKKITYIPEYISSLKLKKDLEWLKIDKNIAMVRLDNKSLSRHHDSLCPLFAKIFLDYVDNWNANFGCSFSEESLPGKMAIDLLAFMTVVSDIRGSFKANFIAFEKKLIANSCNQQYLIIDTVNNAVMGYFAKSHMYSKVAFKGYQLLDKKTELPHEINMSSILIAKEYQRKGISKAVLQFYTKKFEYRKNAFVTVFEENLPSLKTHEAAGFKIIGDKKTNDGRKENLLRWSAPSPH